MSMEAGRSIGGREELMEADMPFKLKFRAEQEGLLRCLCSGITGLENISHMSV